MKNTTIVVLVLLGLYWLFDHYAPFPLSHESLGLYAHNVHRVIGIVLLLIAAYLIWRWKFRKQQSQM